MDRTVHGPRKLSNTGTAGTGKQLPHPWESSMTLGRSLGYVPGDQSINQAQKNLFCSIEVVAKGAASCWLAQGRCCDLSSGRISGRCVDE